MAEQRRELPEFERGRIIGAHDAGMSIREIAELYGVSKSTVHRVIKDFEEEGLTEPRPRSGRPPKINDRQRRHIVRNVDKHHYASLRRDSRRSPWKPFLRRR